MMKMFKIEQVEVEHFRGFRDRRTFDLGGGSNLTVLAGSNGLGKSSFFDAIEWALTGRLFRYEEGDEEKRQTAFISHRPCDRKGVEEPAQVTVTLGNGQTTYHLTRRIKVANGEPDYGDNKTTVELSGAGHIWLEKAATEQLNSLLINDPWQGKLRLQDIFNHYHFLTQDRLDNFVRGSKGPERYNQISQLFGNQRYLAYGEVFLELLSKEEKKLNDLYTAVNQLKFTIVNLENSVRAEESVNLGSFTSFKEYIQALMSELATMAAQHDLTINLTVAAEEDELVLVKACKSRISQAIETVNQQLQQTERTLQQWTALDWRKAQYLTNLQEKARLEAEQAEVKKWQDFEIIRQNLPQYAQFEMRISNFENEIQANLHQYDEQSKRKQAMSQELTRWRQLEESLQNLFGDTVAYPTPSANSTTDLASKSAPNISTFPNISTAPSANPLAHEALAKYSEDVLKLLRQHEWHPDVTETASLLEMRLPKVKEMTSTWQNSSNELAELEKELAILVKSEDELHDLLIKAFDYIQPRHAVKHVEGEICPVCGAAYDEGELLERVKHRISQGNPLTKTKAEKKAALLKYIDALSTFFREEQTIIFKTITYLRTTVQEQTKKLVTDIAEAGMAMENLLLTNRSCEERIAALQLQQEMTINLIKQYHLPPGAKDLELHLDAQAPATLNPFVYRMNPEFINQSAEDSITLSKLEKEIATYEADLAQVGLTPAELTEIATKLNEETEKLSAHQQVYDKARFSETRLLEIAQSLERSENHRKLRETQQHLAPKMDELRRAEQAVQKLEALKAGVRKAVEEMNQRVLDEQADLINKLFRRIYPHPFYRNLNLRFSENNHGNKILTLECQDEQGTNSVNPIWTFSTAQVNVIAVSIFLAMALQQQCTRLATILMDDPIQSMDDINIISFIDILRSCSDENQSGFRQRQIILSTHDDKIYRLMMNKFRFLSAKSITFGGYTERGPVVEIR